MFTWVYFATIMVSAVTGYADQWNLVHFSKSEDELRKCLETINLTEVLDNNIDDEHLKLHLFGQLSHWLNKQTVPVESIEAVADNLVYSLGISVITKDNTKTEQVKNAIVSALNECSDPEDSNSKMSPPHFVQEIPELAELLNMILVHPVQILPYFTEFDYLRLRSLSERSLTLIEMSLRRMNNAHELCNELWSMWRRRAKLFYDGRKDNGYLLSFYISSRIQVFSRPETANRIRLYNKTTRDPPTASIEKDFFEMTKYHTLDWDNPVNGHNFSLPNLVTMTKSQHYFKRQTHQFLQQLFAYLESVERGFTSKSKYDKWKDFEKELRMLYNPLPNAYKAYLEEVQRRELNHDFARNSPIFSSLVWSLEPGDQIDEFDLLMMVWHRLRSPPNFDIEAGPSEFRTTTTATKSTTTPSYTHLSSTSGYDESKSGKGPVKRLPSGKFILKNQRMCGENNNNNNSPSSTKRCKYSKNSNEIYGNYGYIVDLHNGSKPFLFSQYDMRMLELLQDTLLTLLKSYIHVEGSMNCY